MDVPRLQCVCSSTIPQWHVAARNFSRVCHAQWRLSLRNTDMQGDVITDSLSMSIEPPETPEPRRTGHRNWDLLASVVAITISAASLFTAYHTSHSMERLVHASSWPALQLDSSNETAEGAATLTFDIHNTGVGPAQIHDFKIVVDGQPVSSQGWLIDNLAESCCSEARAEALAAAGGDRLAMLGPDTTNRVASRSLAPNEWVSAIRWPKTDGNAALWRQVDLARQSGRIQMRACYCSVFDECWVANSHKFPQQPVRSCS